MAALSVLICILFAQRFMQSTQHTQQQEQTIQPQQDTSQQQTQNTPEQIQAIQQGRYIDVSISAQKVTIFNEQSEVLFQCDCVSGDSAKGNDTPLGTFSVEAKQTNQVLRGARDPQTGKPAYELHVNYWVPFKNNLYGFHDASWQEHFGGQWYKTNGSHGCLNMPPDRMEEFFNLVQVGDCVVIHA